MTWAATSPSASRATCKAGYGRAGIKILASGAIVDEDYLPVIGEAADGIITSLNYSTDHDSALNHQFVRDFAKVTNNSIAPDFGSVAAYDVMAAIYKVVQAQNGVLDPDKTMDLVRNLKFESPRGPIAIDPQTRVLLVSGSNMSGKSTLLRTVGVNTILALAGAPVRARKLRLSPLRAGATLRIQDSLQEGRSRFYAEITRVRQLVELAKGAPPLLAM